MPRLVTATFPSREDAGKARDALLRLGVPPARIAIHEEPAQPLPRASAKSPGGEPGLPSLLDALFLPPEDLAAHRAALRRGHVVLSAEVEDSREAATIDALDDAGALDLDEAPSGAAPAGRARSYAIAPPEGTPRGGR